MFEAGVAATRALSADRWWKTSRRILPHSATRSIRSAVNSGTDALRFALMAAGVKNGDDRCYRAAHFYRHHRSDHPSGRAARVRRHSTSAPTTWIRRNCESIWKQKLSRKTQCGELIERSRSGRP